MADSLHPDAQAPVRSSRWSLIEVGALVLAVVFAHLVYRHGLSLPIVYDAADYWRIAEEIWSQGLFKPFSFADLRTYGYPSLLGGMLWLARLLGVESRWFVFELQLLLHLLGADAVRRALAITSASPTNRRVVYCSLLLNPVVLIYPAYAITESVSLTLTMLLFACSVRSIFGDTPLLALGAGSFLCGLVVMIRPSNLFLSVPWTLVVLVTLLRRTGSWRRAAAWAVPLSLAAAVPLLPQVRNNVVFFDVLSPLPAGDLRKLQHAYGVQMLKYATACIPGQAPEVPYLNPLADQDAATEPSLGWYAVHPLAGLATAALHIFNVLDQDLPLPYNTTLTPWYYPAVSIANLAVVAVGSLGLGVAVRRMRGRPGRRRLLLWAVVMALACHLGLHSTVAVETRFGAPALMILYPFAALTSGYALRIRRRRSSIALLATVIALVAAGTALSGWVRDQAPAIRAAELVRSGG